MDHYTIRPMLDSSRPNKTGECQLRICVTMKGKRSFYPSGIKLQPDHWNGTDIIKHPNRSVLMASLRNKIIATDKLIIDQGAKTTKITKAANPSFHDFAWLKIKEFTGVQGVRTVTQKIVSINKFHDFNPSIKVKEITREVLVGFESYCRSLGNETNTVWNNTKIIKAFLNLAVDEGIIQSSPGKKFKGAKYIDPHRIVLTSDELDQLEQFADNPLQPTKLKNAVAWFLFSCYTGLRYGDLQNFKGLVNGKVQLQTQKTKEIVSIYATDQIIKSVARLSTEIISDQKLNDYIKIIIASLGIEKRVTVHLARHTFAVEYLIRGGDFFVLSKILGHADVKTTAIYAKLANQRADEDMKKVWQTKPPA
jgi:integrase/recombinase XerD